MQNGIGWLSLAACFGLAVAADAQTPLSQTAGSQFDGTYAFVSSTKLTEMYTVPNGRMRPCPDFTAGPLTIERGQARFSAIFASSPVHMDFEGTVGSQGELGMRSLAPDLLREDIAERGLRGRIDGTGTVRAHLTGRWCNYDYVWRK